MSRMFIVEVKFGAKFVVVDRFIRYTDALHYIKENSGEIYPMRIVRIAKTVVFEEKKT